MPSPRLRGVVALLAGVWAAPGASGHGLGLQINPALGVPGYPDCRRASSRAPSPGAGSSENKTGVYVYSTGSHTLTKARSIRSTQLQSAVRLDGATDLECFQRGAGTAAIKIGCVGDSITAGVHSSNRGTMAYPAQLQRMIDATHGKGRYAVTNLGAYVTLHDAHANACARTRAQMTQ